MGTGYSKALEVLQKERCLMALGIASFAFPLLSLPFYERVFIFCDMVLVTCAAYAAEYLLVHVDVKNLALRTYLVGAALCVAAGLLFGIWWREVNTLYPLIAEEDISKIETVGAKLPQEAYLLTTSEEAPWYQGWTRAHVIAPGLLHDTHNLEEWTSFWEATSTAAKIEFLNSFPRPLYVSTLRAFDELLGTPLPCLTPIAPQLLKNECVPPQTL